MLGAGKTNPDISSITLNEFQDVEKHAFIQLQRMVNKVNLPDESSHKYQAPTVTSLAIIYENFRLFGYLNAGRG
jgi:hypothetical protein